MKIFISADIEGVTGIMNWDEATKGKSEYNLFSDIMTKEVKSACEGAFKGGASEILIKDGHDRYNNININELLENVKLVRGSTGHPFRMMQELDATFDAVLMIGYHSYAGSNGNPISHTMSLEILNIKINGKAASEFMINSYTAAYNGVPVIFISGDKMICEHAKEFNPNINIQVTNECYGDAAICVNPKLNQEKIRTRVEESIKKDTTNCKIRLPDEFEVEITFKKHQKAYKSSFYPGVKQIGPQTIVFKQRDYFEVLRTLSFII